MFVLELLWHFEIRYTQKKNRQYILQGNKVDLQKQLVSSKVGRADWEKVILKYSKNADFWKAKFIVYPLATDSLIDSRNSVWNFESR